MVRAALPALLLTVLAAPASAQTDRSLLLSYGRASTADGTGDAVAAQAIPFARHLSASASVGAGAAAWLANTRLDGRRRQILGAGPLLEAAFHPIWHGPWLVGTLGLQYVRLFGAEGIPGASPLALRIPSDSEPRNGPRSSLAASWGLGVRQQLSGSAVLSLEYTRVRHALTDDRAGRGLGRASLGVGVVY